jgi:hypothetical protein
VSKIEAEFLRKIHSTVPQIIYVLNKTDLLDKKQLEKLINFNIKVIADITNKAEHDVIIVPVSCKLAVENGGNGNFDLLTSTIDQMIEENKNLILIETGRNRLNIIAKSILQLLTIQVETMQMPLKMIEKKQAELKKSAEVLFETRHEFDILVKGQLDRIIERHMIKTEELLHDLSRQMKQKVTSAFNLPNVINNKTIIELSKAFSDEFFSNLNQIKSSTEQAIVDEFNLLLLKYQARPDTFLNEFSRLLNELFGLSFDILSDRFDLNVYTSFYFLKFVDGQSMEPKLPAIYRFFPEKLRQLKYQSILKKNAEILIEINKGRMIPDISYKVNESFKKFKAEEEKQVELVYQRINKLLDEAIEKKAGSNIEIEQELRNLTRKIEILKSKT